jgi:hypothetical protein
MQGKSPRQAKITDFWKIMIFRFSEDCVYLVHIRSRHEGRIAIVTTRGAGCDGRKTAQREFHTDERRFAKAKACVLAPLGWC